MPDPAAPTPPAATPEAPAVDLQGQWASLQPNQFQLLRLSPQPTERGSGSRPLRFARLGRVERHHPQQSMLRLSIDLPGQVLHKENNRFELWADHRTRELRIGLEGGLQTEPANRGLGRLLLAQGIIWAKQRWGIYQVASSPLPTKSLLDDNARARRERVLKAQGFKVAYDDSMQLKGTVSAGKVSELLTDWNQEKVQIIDLLDAGQMLQQADQSLQEQALKIRQAEDRVAAFKRNEGSLRFSVNALLGLCGFLTLLLLFLVFS